MSHGGGGGGFGHGGGGHHGHGGHHGMHSGGHPDQLPSWNSALQGGKRSHRYSNFSPKPIFLALFIFGVMLVPFVLDWDNPVLQRMLIGHDLTAKEIAHQNAVNQAVAGTMRSQASHLLGSEAADALVPDAPVTGSSLIAEPAAPSSIPDNRMSNGGGGGGGIGNFSISAGEGANGGVAGGGGMARQMAPASNYMAQGGGTNFGQPANNFGQATLGSNQRFISQPYGGGGVTEYHGPRHKVVVDR